LPILSLPKFLLPGLGLAILIGAIWLLRDWWVGLDIGDSAGVLHHVHGPTRELIAGLVLLSWSVLGRPVVLMFIRGASDEPRHQRTQGRTVVAPDGSSLHVEEYGRQGAPVLVLTHGWGLDSTVWAYARRSLSDGFRLVVWDLPGLGRSHGPADGRYSIDRFAEALGAVVRSVEAERVVLVGHSIGGMTTLTFWRACPEDLKRRVAGLALVDTTYQNPLRTMWLRPLWTAVQKPLIEPVNHLTVWLSPLVWLSSWQGYLNGSNQLAMRLTGFGRFATRWQVDHVARLASKGSPAVQAKGNLAMIHWSMAEHLPQIDVPTLVLAGDRDIVTLPAASEHIGGAAPRAQTTVVPGCGHMGFMERHDAYNSEIAAFAGRVLAVSPGTLADSRRPDPEAGSVA
jgi:pimeloyl-ACP methyl ester carboxylesterase